MNYQGWFPQGHRNYPAGVRPSDTAHPRVAENWIRPQQPTTWFALLCYARLTMSLEPVVNSIKVDRCLGGTKRFSTLQFTAIYKNWKSSNCEFFEREIVAHKLFFRRDLLRL